MAQLTVLKDAVCAYISADDISILNERMELLQRQWEELCHQVRQTLDSVSAQKGRELEDDLECLWLCPHLDRGKDTVLIIRMLQIKTIIS